MKPSLLAITILITLATLAQEKPVKWNLVQQKIDDTTYQLRLQGFPKQDWYVYAKDDLQSKLEGVKIISDSEVGRMVGIPQPLSGLVQVNDPVFASNQMVFKGPFELKQKFITSNPIAESIVFTILAYASNGKEFLTIEDTLELEFNKNQAKTVLNQVKIASIDSNHPVANCGDAQTQQHSGLSTIFILGFLGGLLALITPCVFPMIPVTVSFFMGKSKNRGGAVKNGVRYGAFIFLIYLLASSPFHLITGIDKNIFNSIATNPWLNVGFFLIFIVFALSFFGLFEITLPATVATKADSKSNLSTVSGIFFMALTLAIVSFSCTGVILGVLLANVAANGPWALTTGMAGFGLALALPFALFAMFPQLLKKLPKSGSWLDTVKKSLAFIELALAFKFLSNADLVEHWGLLKREVFIAIWIIISLALALYLLGLFEKKHTVVAEMQNTDRVKSRKAKLSNTRMALGFAVLAFAFYLFPGITKARSANLRLLSGFAPPLSYSVYGKENAKGRGLQPLVINDYQKALQLAKLENKPLLIDFTGWACVNCRKMEEHVWTNPQIASLISDRFILVSLYVDDKKKLPGDQQFTYTTAEGEKKHIKTIGDRWAAFQAENFQQVTQPLYVILSPDEKLLNYPVGYTPDATIYKNWLTCALSAAAAKK